MVTAVGSCVVASATPVVIAASQAASAPPATGGGSTSGSAIVGRKLLIVDDEVMQARAMARALGKDLGIGRDDIFLAENVASALAVYDHHKNEIVAVLTDVDMPGGKNGFDLYAALRGETCLFTGPIALWSAMDHSAELPRISGDPKARYFHKPRELEELRAWLRSQLAG